MRDKKRNGVGEKPTARQGDRAQRRNGQGGRAPMRNNLGITPGLRPVDESTRISLEAQVEAFRASNEEGTFLLGSGHTHCLFL
jgi:hypothetical protein